MATTLFKIVPSSDTLDKTYQSPREAAHYEDMKEHRVVTPESGVTSSLEKIQDNHLQWTKMSQN